MSTAATPISTKATPSAPSSDYDPAIKLDPKYAAAFTERGNTYAARGMIDRALQDYEQAIKFNPTYAGVFNSRAMLWQRKGDLTRALADLDQAIKLDPGFAVGALNNRGKIYQEQGRPRPRHRRLRPQAIKVNPHYDVAFNSRGLAYKDKGEFERAVEDFDQAPQAQSRLRDGAAQSRRDAGGARLPRRAIKDLDQALRLNPSNAPAL